MGCMMKTVGLYEAKTHLGELISEVENGETLIVTRRGVPVARVTPICDEFADAAAAIEDWRRFRKEHNIRLGGGITIRELIDEGRK
jgi:prevent-host-death family protein